MTRRHRGVHRIVWPILSIVVAAGFVLALYLRPPPDGPSPPPAAETPR